MNEPESDEPTTYRVIPMPQLADDIRDLHQLAMAVGDRFVSALKTIHQRLTAAPLDFGELIHNFRHLQLIVHVGTVYPLTARFAIDEARHLVYILQLVLATN